MLQNYASAKLCSNPTLDGILNWSGPSTLIPPDGWSLSSYAYVKDIYRFFYADSVGKIFQCSEVRETLQKYLF